MIIQQRPYFDLNADDIPALVYHLLMAFHAAQLWGNDATHSIDLNWLRNAAGNPDLDEWDDANKEMVPDFRPEFNNRMARPGDYCCHDAAGVEAIKNAKVKPTLEDALAAYEAILKEHNIAPDDDVLIALWW